MVSLTERRDAARVNTLLALLIALRIIFSTAVETSGGLDRNAQWLPEEVS